MPINLAVPVVAGGLDPSTPSYGELKIVDFRFAIEARKLIVTLEYGNTVDGKWIPSNLADRFITCAMSDHYEETVDPETGEPVMTTVTDFSQFLLTTMPNEGESLYEAVKRSLYTWVLEELELEGSVT